MKITERTNFVMSLTTLIAVIIFITTATYGFTTWKTEIESRVEYNYVNMVKVYDQQKSVISEQNIMGIQFAKVLTNQEWMIEQLKGLQAYVQK